MRARGGLSNRRRGIEFTEHEMRYRRPRVWTCDGPIVTLRPRRRMERAERPRRTQFCLFFLVIWDPSEWRANYPKDGYTGTFLSCLFPDCMPVQRQYGLAAKQLQIPYLTCAQSLSHNRKPTSAANCNVRPCKSRVVSSQLPGLRLFFCIFPPPSTVAAIPRVAPRVP